MLLDVEIMVTSAARGSQSGINIPHYQRPHGGTLWSGLRCGERVGLLKSPCLSLGSVTSGLSQSHLSLRAIVGLRDMLPC